MSWRKKTKAEALVFLESNEERSSFRVCPPASEPVRTAIRGKSVLLENIGAAGLAFRSKGFKPGDSQRIVFDLPTENITISVTVEIIAIDSDGMCHCRFVGLSEDDHNAIHRYMLAVQIREVRKKRKSLGSMRQPEEPASPGRQLQRSSIGISDGSGAYPRPKASPAHCK